MHDALVVRGGQGVRDRRRDLEQPIERQSTGGNHVIERLPLDQLHRQKVDALLTWTRGFFDREDGDDVGVIERGERLRLASKAVEPLPIACDVGGKHLDGDVAPEPRVARTIDLAHAACSEQRQDRVRPKRLACGE